MQSLQEQIKEICQLADKTIENPTLTPIQTAQKLGLSPSIVGFIKGNGLVADLIIYGPVVGGLMHLWKKYTDSEKEKLEKERMLREIIAKQQAVIKKLEFELNKSQEINAHNRNDINNLKEMLHLLEKAKNHLNKTV